MSVDYKALNLFVSQFALVPSQTMAKRVRAVRHHSGITQFSDNGKKTESGRILANGDKEMVSLFSVSKQSDRFEERLVKDKKTGEKTAVIIDRNNQGTNENVELLTGYLVSYCQRKLKKMRAGKGKGKNVDLDHNKEVTFRKKDGKRILRKMPVLKGSQAHIRDDSFCVADALDSVQNALLFWVQANLKAYLGKMTESEMVSYIRQCKQAGKAILPPFEERILKPLSYRMLSIGCFQTMENSRKWFRKVDSVVWSNRHGIARIGDELAKDELAKGLPPIVSIPVQEIKEELESLPTESRTQKNTKNILLMRLNGMKSADIARELGFPFAYVRLAIQRFRKANPYLCHKVLTPV